MLGSGNTPQSGDQWGAGDPHPNDDHWGSGERWGAAERSMTAAGKSAGKAAGWKIAALVVAVVLVLAAGGFGVWKYMQEEDNPAAAQPTPVETTAEPADEEATQKQEESDETEPTKEEAAETEVLLTSEGSEQGSCDVEELPDDMFDPVSFYCDGQWHFGGHRGSSYFVLQYWTGDTWEIYRTDRQNGVDEQFQCYDREPLEDAGAPERLVEELVEYGQLCASDEARTQSQGSDEEEHPTSFTGDWLPYAKCNGEYALIVDSVLVYNDDNPMPPVEASLEAHPGAQSTYPGHCGAFRAEAEGAIVYPIYIDYGSDLAGVCAAEARGEGNARRLTSAVDYSSPC